MIYEKERINNNLESDVLEASRAFNLEDIRDVKELLASLINTYHVSKG